MELLSSSCAPTESPLKELNVGFAAKSSHSMAAHSATRINPLYDLQNPD
jgi:hypothetical protein